MEPHERYTGSLLGLAIGDAMGMPVERFGAPKQPVTGFRGGGFLKLNAGEWTDDTSQALCLADSLVKMRRFDPYDALSTFVRWLNEGYLSCRAGQSFGCGGTTYGALNEFESRPRAFCGSTIERTASNGSLMRLAPVPLVYANNPHQGITYAADSSCTTHGAHESVDACRYLAALIIGAVHGCTKEQLCSDHFDSIEPSIWQSHPLSPAIDTIAAGSFKDEHPPTMDRERFGKAKISLHVALWGFYHTSSFADGLLKVVNIGWDADTNGAIYGQLAGAYYGESGIPQEWREQVAHTETIHSYGMQLFELSQEVK